MEIEEAKRCQRHGPLKPLWGPGHSQYAGVSWWNGGWTAAVVSWEPKEEKKRVGMAKVWGTKGTKLGKT